MAARGGSKVRQVTVISPTTWPHAWGLLGLWQIFQRSTKHKQPVMDLGFIHVAHWGLVDRLPASAPHCRSNELPSPYIVFHSNFNGPLKEYLEMFAFKVPDRMERIWERAPNWPGMRPVQAFVEFVAARTERYEGTGAHYYCAYPQTTVKSVNKAIRLRDRYARFASRAGALAPEDFAREWHAFLTDAQLDL